MSLIAIIFITAFIFIFLITNFLLKDLTHYYWNTLRAQFSLFNEKEANFGELLVGLMTSIFIGTFAYLLYRSIVCLVAYSLSGDLISFFTLNRGVFSTAGTDLQNPYAFKNLIVGLILNPIAQFASVFFIIKSTKYFMYSVNSFFSNQNIYTKSSQIFFSTFSILTLIIIDLASYTQSVSLISTMSLVILLIASKLSYLLFFFGAVHIDLTGNSDYTQALKGLNLNPLEKNIIYSPFLMATSLIVITAILEIPLYSGFQFGPNNWSIILQMIVFCIIFYIILKAIFSNGFNFIGVYMLDDSKNKALEPFHYHKMLKSKRSYYTIAFFVIFLLLLKPKSLFFFLFFLIIIGIIYTLSVLTIYCVGTLYSKIFNKYKWEFHFNLSYIKLISKAFIKTISPVILFLIFTFLVLTLFPKKNDIRSHNNYVKSVIDNNGNLLYSQENDDNPSIPISFNDLPKFFIKGLKIKEDRYVSKQNDFMFNTSNWHGVSFTGRSNINQQLVKNLAFEKQFPQEVQRKFSEFISSYQLSLQSSTEEIINHYANVVSFNGGIGHSGISNASFETFGRSIQNINELEILYLLFTLHRGSTFKINDDEYIPYKEAHFHTDKIRTKLLKYAKLWYSDGQITKREYRKLKSQDLQLTNSKYKPVIATTTRLFLSNQLEEKESQDVTFQSSLSQENQMKISNAVFKFENNFRNYLNNDGNHLYSAALVVDVKTGKIIAHHGGDGLSDLSKFGDGNPIGSLVKPFVLLQLLEDGFDFSDIKLYNGPILGKRTPHNYNNTYTKNMMGVNDILSKSLNMPMVNIREIIDPVPLYKRVEDNFKHMNIPKDNLIRLDEESRSLENIINYPLGSRRMTIFDIAQSYQTIFNNGKTSRLHTISKSFNPYTLKERNYEQHEYQVFNTKNTSLIKNALKKTIMEGGTAFHLKKYLPNRKNLMMKTGTSDKALHGYAIISDGKTLVVSWASYGIRNGNHLELNNTPPIPHGNGGSSAGILAAFIFKELCFTN